MSYLFALTAVILGAAGQVFFKLGATSRAFMHLGTYTLAGFALYGASALLWLFVLARLPLSTAYPLLALNFVLVQLAGTLFFGEPFTAVKGVGLALIVAGVWMTQAG